MHITQLEYFLAAAEYEHITQAANSLNVTQSALSKAIARLEEDVGVPLFDRVKKRIYLNESGQQFKYYVDAFFDTIAEGVTAGRQAAEIGKKTIAVGSGTKWFVDVCVREYLIEHPDCQIHYDILDREGLNRMLTEGRCRFAVSVTGPFGSQDLAWQHVMTEDVFVLSGKMLTGEAQGNIHLKDLKAARFFIDSASSEWRDLIYQWCRRAGFYPEVVFDNTNMPGQTELLIPMQAVIFAPAHVAVPFYYSKLSHSRNGPYLYHLEDDYCKIHYGVSTRKDLVMENWQTDFMKFVISTIRTAGNFMRQRHLTSADIL